MANLAYRRTGLLTAAITAVFLALGCATSGMTTPVGSNLNPGSGASEPQGASKELSVARGFIQSGNFSQAIPRLMHVVNDFPSSTHAVEAHFMLGQTYYELGGYGDAVEHFQKSLALAPEGPFAPWCKDYLSRLTDAEGRPYSGEEVADTRMAEVYMLIEENPEELAYQLELADLFWKNGQYAEAGALYNEMFMKWPRLVQDMALRQRIEWTGEGIYTVLTPEEVVRRRSETDPLLVHNTTSFRSGRLAGYNRSFRETQYNVTGNALNRGSEPLRNVNLHVTIYGFGNRIYETKRVSIGRLEPGVSRPFSVTFTQFDDLENVSRFEIQGEYDR